MNPINIINQVTRFKSFEMLIAGLNKEKKEAASIIPAAIATKASITLLLIALKKNTIEEPNTVTKNVKTPANNAW